jgi:hypothetical protein
LRGGIRSSWEEMSLPFMRAEESTPRSIPPPSRTHRIERTPVDSAGCNRLLNAGEGDAPDDGVPLPVSTSRCRRAPETDMQAPPVGACSPGWVAQGEIWYWAELVGLGPIEHSTLFLLYFHFPFSFLLFLNLSLNFKFVMNLYSNFLSI